MPIDARRFRSADGSVPFHGKIRQAEPTMIWHDKPAGSRHGGIARLPDSIDINGMGVKTQFDRRRPPALEPVKCRVDDNAAMRVG